MPKIKRADNKVVRIKKKSPIKIKAKVYKQLKSPKGNFLRSTRNVA